MAEQFLSFAIIPGKDGRYHIDLCRKLLRAVEAEQPTQRRFALWLQQNQIFDRALLQFLLKLCDVKVAQKATLGEIGMELALEAAKSPRPALPDPAHLEAVARATKEKKAPPPPPPEPKDPFKEALFQRFVELNGYLARFVFCEIQDGFLAEKEITIRVQSALYRGERPTGAQLAAWVKWMEFLGYLKVVGFRHKLSEGAGIDAWKYLREIPEDTLIEKGAAGVLEGLLEPEGPADTRKFLTAEELGAGPNTEAGAAPPPPIVGAPLAPSRPGGRGEANGDDDEEADADFGPEGAAPPGAPEDLDLEPETAPPGARVVKRADDQEEEEEEEEEELTAEDEENIRALFGEVHTPPPRPKKLALPPAAAAAAPAPEGTPAGAPAPGGAPVAGRGPGGASAPGGAAPAPLAGPKPDAAPPSALSPAPDPAALAEKAAAAEARAERAAPEPAEARAAIAPRAAAPVERLSPPPRSPEPAPPAPSATALGPPAGTLRDEHVDLLAAQWESTGGRRPISARDAGVPGTADADGRRAFALFSLVATATILEADAPFAAKAELLRELERARAFESVFELDWTLEKLLDALGMIDGAREIGPAEERLLHLPRLKRALSRKTVIETLDGAKGERADLLRQLTGHALAGGAYWVEREMRRLGLW